MARRVAGELDAADFDLLVVVHNKYFVQRVEDVLVVEEHFVAIVHLEAVAQDVFVNGFGGVGHVDRGLEVGPFGEVGDRAAVVEVEAGVRIWQAKAIESY